MLHGFMMGAVSVGGGKDQGNRSDGLPGAHIDARYNGLGGKMYKQFNSNYGFH